MHKSLAVSLSTLLLLASCGGGSGYSTPPPPPPPPTGPNVATLTVDSGPPTVGAVNTVYVSVTVCAPGSSSNCQTIDHIQVDTASWGLRVMASVLNASLLSALPQQMVANTTTPVVECVQFADGYSWGPVVSADVGIASEKASNIPIQVIGSASFPATMAPSDCTSSGVLTPENTVTSFGANGLIGVGVFMRDCDFLGGCATNTVPGTYYACPTNGAACSGIMEPIASQVANPVGAFAADNNGVIVEFPSVAANGATTATGALIFGIGTQSNNALASAATTLATDANAGTITVTFNNTTYPLSILDSGSNAYFFADSALHVYPNGQVGAGFYGTVANISTTITTLAGAQLAANFAVGDAASMFQANPNGTAFPQLAGPIGASQSQTFDFGLPYFYGRNVYVAIQSRSAGGTMGPYFAY